MITYLSSHYSNTLGITTVNPTACLRLLKFGNHHVGGKTTSNSSYDTLCVVNVFIFHPNLVQTNSLLTVGKQVALLSQTSRAMLCVCLSVVSFSSVIPRVLFLSRVSILTRDIDIANPSVCLSVTFRYQMKTA